MPTTPIQPSLHVVSDAHVKPTIAQAGIDGHSSPDPSGQTSRLSEVTVSAAAVATLIGAVRLAGSDRGNAARTWAESVDQSSAPSIACWLYATMLMTDRYHPTRRGYVPFIYESASEAAEAFFAEALRSTYPHLDKAVAAEAYTILEELMRLSGHVACDQELAWQRSTDQGQARLSGLKPVAWLGRNALRCVLKTSLFLGYFLVYLSGGQPPRRTAPTPLSPPSSTDAAPRPTTPAVLPDRGSVHR